MPAGKVTHKAVRMITPTSGTLHVRRSDNIGSGLWPGFLLAVLVINLPWMPVASSRVNQMPPVIAVKLGLRADTNPIK